MDKKEAIEIIKNEQFQNGPLLEALKTLIPELQSEDERIRTTLIRLFTEDTANHYGGFTKKQVVSWLEKQGEQKSDYNPYKVTVESITIMVEKYANGDLKDFYDNVKVKCKDAVEYDKTFEKQGEQKSEWSEDDDAILNALVQDIQERHPDAMWRINTSKTATVSTEFVIKWLKSFKPQSHWKPSAEQLKVLQKAIKDYGVGYEGSILTPLYNDLLKL